jgi:hypothetical protein
VTVKWRALLEHVRVIHSVFQRQNYGRIMMFTARATMQETKVVSNKLLLNYYLYIH